MHIGGRTGLRRNELGIPVDVDMVLVAVVVLPTFLCPAGINVFLRQLGRGLAPFNRYRVGF